MTAKTQKFDLNSSERSTILNGHWTINDRKTGEHRTVRVKTTTFNKGKDNEEVKVIIGLLTGSDNTSDYKGFGFVSKCGKYINVWNRCRRAPGAKMTKFEMYAWIIQDYFTKNGERWSKRFEITGEAKCRRCNKLLTTEESVTQGLGPICVEKGFA